MVRKTALYLALALAPTGAFAQSGANSEWSVSTYKAPEQSDANMIGNDDVIQLALSGVSDMVIMTMIRNSEPNFDLSSDGLIDLSNAGVSQPVITAMISRSKAGNPRVTGAVNTPRRGQPTITQLSTDSPDPMIPHVPGMYIINPAGGIGKMRMVHPVEAELEGGGGMLGGMMSMATAGMMGGSGARAHIKGANALIRTTNRSPVFYMYFDESVPEHMRSHAPTIWGAGGGDTISTPQDLQLVQFEEKKNRREARIGKKLKDKHEILFSTELLAPGIYRLTVRSRLQPGEYGFVQSMLANDGKGRNEARIFDFEVH